MQFVIVEIKTCKAVEKVPSPITMLEENGLTDTNPVFYKKAGFFIRGRRGSKGVYTDPYKTP